MDLTLAEELLLLVLDAEKGAKRPTTALDGGFAGALLVDLGRQGLLRTEGKTVQVVPDGTPEHPVLARTYQVISDSPRSRTAKSWVTRLPRELRPIAQTIAGPLVERGRLRRRQQRLAPTPPPPPPTCRGFPPGPPRLVAGFQNDKCPHPG